ncbi:MAG: trypsin-like peptidase domain-containing protein [Parvularculaceae bacterium]|jgi:hypothetical protein|nr:trypsin-like peptidase domain-containing protein [Parvularculaceae bacterium]
MSKFSRGFGVSGALALAGVAAVAGALAFSEWLRREDLRKTRDEVAALKAEVAVARDEARAALSAVIDQETLAAASASVYLIVVNGAPRGTAFVVDRDKGLLATAGHTAESLPLDDPKAEVLILNRNLRSPIKVASKRVHAGFSAFRILVESYQPTRKNSSIYSPQAAPVRDLAFDAGLITVDPIDSKSGANRLGPNLPLAPEEDLLRLAAGGAIAIIGYPYDTLDDGFAADAAISRIDRGVIAAVMPPLDAAGEDPDPRVANLIIHRLSTAGGSSGSPVINARGEVVGVHTHGIESISSNADGAAQRADVLYDLLAPERETRRVNELFLPAWSKTLTHWARTKDALPWSFYMEYARPGVDPAPKVGDIAGTEPPFAKIIEDLKFRDPVDSYRVAAPDAAAAGGAFRIDERGQYAETWISVDRSLEAVLFAYDYSLRSRSGSCRLATYWRRKGESRLATQKPRASFELRLEAEALRTDEYHLIFRRDADCDPGSPDFFAGSISWPAAAEIVAASYAEAPAAPAAAEGIYHAAQQALGRVACALSVAPKEDCDGERYIELEPD